MLANAIQEKASIQARVCSTPQMSRSWLKDCHKVWMTMPLCLPKSRAVLSAFSLPYQADKKEPAAAGSSNLQPWLYQPPGSSPSAVRTASTRTSAPAQSSRRYPNLVRVVAVGVVIRVAIRRSLDQGGCRGRSRDGGGSRDRS